MTQERVEAELDRLSKMDEVQRQVLKVSQHVREEVLNCKCPRCGQVFVNFEGCFALKCSRCPCAFCGWCLCDSGSDDAHDHVRTCQHKPPGADVFFGTEIQFEQAVRNRRIRLLRAYFDEQNFDLALKDKIMLELQPDFEALELDNSGWY